MRDTACPADDVKIEVQEYLTDLHLPGRDTVTDGRNLAASPHGKALAFTGIQYNDLDSPPATQVCMVELDSRELRSLPLPFNAEQPQWNPKGDLLAFLGEKQTGHLQLMISDRHGENSYETPPLDGTIEYFTWSPDGSKILFGLAGSGADLAGSDGGTTLDRRAENEQPRWTPSIESGNSENLWRSAYIYDLSTRRSQKIGPEGLNIWEVVWFGTDAVAAIVSDSHSESSWYDSRVVAIHRDSAEVRDLYIPRTQIGTLSASPCGKKLAFIESLSSDRLNVCGSLMLHDLESTECAKLDTDCIDVSCIVWHDSENLLLAGLREQHTVVATYNLVTKRVSVTWTSERLSTVGWFPLVCSLPGQDCALLAEGFNTPPEIALVGEEGYQSILSLSSNEMSHIAFESISAKSICWTAPDGIKIHGWLLKPEGKGPFPLVTDIHGGPVWAFRPRWQSRLGATALLVKHGFAVFFPNPRGSNGKGEDFVSRVRGDMGGQDALDILSGLDHLVREGIADPERIGATGISYGGFMTCWLISQSERFAAAVPISPVTNWYSQHLTSHIPGFDSLFLDDDPYSPDGEYFHRSPFVRAKFVNTPTLILVGGADKSTPPAQGLEFHRALLEFGAESTLVTYPEAGHGIRKFPEQADLIARVLNWFSCLMS